MNFNNICLRVSESNCQGSELNGRSDSTDLHSFTSSTSQNEVTVASEDMKHAKNRNNEISNLHSERSRFKLQDGTRIINTYIYGDDK
jgi:hypothetical protein